MQSSFYTFLSGLTKSELDELLTFEKSPLHDIFAKIREANAKVSLQEMASFNLEGKRPDVFVTRIQTRFNTFDDFVDISAHARIELDRRAGEQKIKEDREKRKQKTAL